MSWGCIGLYARFPDLIHFNFSFFFFSPVVHYASVNLISDFHNCFENYKYLFYEALWKVVAPQALQRDAEKNLPLKVH